MTATHSPILSAAGRLGAARRWGRAVDRTAATAAMRRGFDASFVRQAIAAAEEAGIVDPSPEQIARSAASFRAAHYAAMSLARARKAAR